MKKLLAATLVLALSAAAPAWAKVTTLPDLGLEFEIPEDAQEKNVSVSSSPFEDISGIMIEYINYDIIAPLSDAAKEAMMSGDTEAAEAAAEAFNEAYDAHTGVYYIIAGFATENAAEKLTEYGYDAEELQVVGANSTHTYYLLTVDREGLSEEDKALMEAGQATADALLSSVKVIEIDLTASQTDDLPEQLTSFTTVDMNGETVTADIFARADLTVLNIWGTFCAPCISEMPELAAWAKELPENVQLVGLIVDVASAEDKTYAKAAKILEKSGAEFTNLLYNDSLAELCANISGTPTTLFLDSEGNTVYEAVLGADMEAYKSAVNALLGQ